MFAIVLAAAAAATPLKFPADAPVVMDYLVADGARVWAPGGNTGKVFLLEGGKFKSVDGFATKEGRNNRLMGPSAATMGKGAVFIGNRGDSKIWAIDSKTMEKKGSIEMPSTPDGVFYVGTTNEVWVTTPRDNSIQVVDFKDVSAPKIVGKIAADGPEGYAVDEKRGIVYTNLEDKDATIAIDAKTRKVVSTWEHTCGKDGPRGLAVDADRGVLFVACASQGLLALDAKTGAKKFKLDVGEGVDNIDYLPARRLVYATAGRSEKLTVAHLEDDGSLKVVASTPVGKGCRVVVATQEGTAYAADSTGGQLWVFKP